VIPGDLSAELARLLIAQAGTGALPPAAAKLTANGTWRPARTDAEGSPGSYTTSLPFQLASLAGRPPDAIAAQLAASLASRPWISAARAAGGYLTVTVTASHLAGLPARIVAAGPASAHSDSLAGRRLTAPYLPDIATMADWPQAWRTQHAALAGTFGRAAGAHLAFFHAESKAAAAPRSGGFRGVAPPGKRRLVGVSPPSVAVAYFGVDAVRFALAAVAAPRSAAIERQLARPLNLMNPFVAVRHAHADAASTVRWAADLGLPTAMGQDEPGVQPATLQPAERVLIEAMSWLPERVAAAHRRSRPAELVVYLGHLAQAWLDCSERCSALPFRGRAGRVARDNPAVVAARLELAMAARATLGAGLGLLGVAAPAMM
jgi:arginyl-tRNA synthetase